MFEVCLSLGEGCFRVSRIERHENLAVSDMLVVSYQDLGDLAGDARGDLVNIAVDLCVIRGRVVTIEQPVNDAGRQHNGKYGAENDERARAALMRRGGGVGLFAFGGGTMDLARRPVGFWPDFSICVTHDPT